MGSATSAFLGRELTINMKIILALLGFFVAVSWCFPAPEPCFPFCSSTQNCQGSQCGQNNGAGASGLQNCQGSQCNQNNAGGGGGFPGAQFGAFNQFEQNCSGSQCNQNNAGRKKRASVQVRSAKTPFRF